jgi:arylsulfatase
MKRSVAPALFALLALFALSLGLALPACAPSTSKPKVVVWIVVDTLRADALGCYGNARVGENGAKPSPNLDALAKDGLRFDAAHSVAPWTIPSLVSLLSGLWPWEHGQIRLLEPCPADRLPLVPLLRSRGFRTAGVMTNFIAKGELGFDNGFERWDDSFAQGHEGSTSHPAFERLIRFADELREGGKPVFLFAWLFEPHYKYEAHEGFRFGPGFGDEQAKPYRGSLTGDEELPDLQKRRASLGDEDKAFLRGRYQSEVAFVDDAIGKFLDGLKKRGLYDDALVVVTADHGEEILDRGWIGHTVTLHEELVRVPLIVKLPRGDADGRRGATIDAPVSQIDLPATILDLATGDAPDRAAFELGHSRSLAATLRGGAIPDRRWLYLHTDFVPALGDAREESGALQWGVLDARTRRKWIVDHKVDPPRAHLFDLSNDPSEARDLAADPACVRSAEDMLRLRALFPASLAGRRGAPKRLPEEPWSRIAGVDPRSLDGAGPALANEP